MKKLMKLLLSFALISTLLFPVVSNANDDQEITILFTHDMHDNFESYNMEIDGQIQSRGGFARLYTAISNEREKDPELLLVDGGDFSMGTLFQTIFSTESPALRLMGKMGYDATTLGNHEFDFRPEGLANSLIAAKKSGDPIPEILASNTSFPENSDEELLHLKSSFETYGVKDYLVVNKNGYKVGLFGLMGIDSDSNAPMARVNFDNMIQEAKRVVKVLKDEEKVDLIVALSHAGTDGKPGKTEDELLAKEVSDIDVIVSGHSHTMLPEPIIVNDTFIVSSGRYAENLGKLTIKKNQDNWNLENYAIMPIDNSYTPNSEVEEIIQGFKKNIDTEYLSQYDLEYDQVVAHSPFSFTPALELGEVQEEEPLGNLIGDAYFHAIKAAEGSNYKEIDVAVVPYGVIRDSIVQGDLTVKNIFNISPLGIGKDKISGYPLIDVYLTGKELKTAAEVDASIQPLMVAAQLYMSGLQYSFNPNRMIFNKVTDISLVKDSKNIDLESDKLYRVIANLYTAQMLNIVGDKSMGLLSIVPKDEHGVEIKNFEDRIIYNSNNQEVKEWVAVVNYLQSFDKKVGVPQIDEMYAESQGRKIVNTNKDIISRIEKPNIISMAIYSIILVLLVAIIAIVRFIVKKIGKRRMT